MASNPFKYSVGGLPGVGPGSDPRSGTWVPPRRDLGDTRNIPWRPRTGGTPKVTVKPFPNPWKPPTTVFGKKPPLDFTRPGWPVGNNVGRFLPGAVAAALLLGYYLIRPGAYKFPSGWIKCWDVGGPKHAMSGPTLFAGDTCSTGAPDYLLGGQVPSGNYGDPIVVPTFPWEQSIWFGPLTSTGPDRMQYTEKWRYPDLPGVSGPFLIPFEPGAVIIPEVPLPWAPIFPGVTWMPVPWAPPISPTTPQPNPDPRTDPTPEPYGPPATTVVPVPSVVPSVDINTDLPGVTPFPNVHVQEWPKEPDKEKKKRLTGKQSAAWLAALEASGTSYMEMDDVVSAIYKGLPWQVRRWRGRDGVWRDRDITSADRMSRIYELFGKLDIAKAIENVASQEMADTVIGSIGNQLADRARALGDAGLYNRPVGFQYGNNKVAENWKELDRLRKEEAARNILAHTRTYKVKKYDATTNSWYWEEHVRPFTQIPWFRQRSNYNGLARPGMGEYYDLTEAEKESGVRTVPRYYYAPRGTYNPIMFPDEKRS